MKKVSLYVLGFLALTCVSLGLIISKGPSESGQAMPVSGLLEMMLSGCGFLFALIWCVIFLI